MRRFAPFGLILVLLLGSFGVGATATPPRQLNIGVVAGGEIRGLQAIAPTWDKATGVRLNLIVYPYASLYEKMRSEEHTSELQSRENLVCRLLLEKKN